ncbi:CHAT domain-containing protein [Betaproteobacteria bacterium PRO7]|nr:CHAT domain-containing protein [Betaproteobacteria bacterium PRO7]
MANPAPLYSPVTQPVEHLAERVARGELRLDQARALAAAPGITARLDLGYTQSVAQLIHHLTKIGRGEPALVVADVLLAAVQSLPDDAAGSKLRAPGELAYIESVQSALREKPDWRNYRAAGAVGARLLRRAHRLGDAQLARWAHNILGELHFQPLVAPYAGGGSWPAAIGAWYRRGGEISGKARPFPPPAVAFANALRHFRRAARGAPDEDRCWALKGQVQALEWLQRVRGTSHAEEIAALAAEALPLIDPREDLAGISYLMNLRQQAGHPIDAEVFKRALAVPVQELIDRSGPAATVTAHLNLAHLIEPLDARLALALIERAAPAVEQAQDANVLARHCNALIGTLVATLSTDAIDNGAGTLAAARGLRARAEAEQWSVPRVVGALLALVRDCPARNEEIEGLKLLETAQQVFPDPFNAYPAAMNFWRMTLWSGEGVNNANAGKLREAMASYANALRLAVPLGLREFALQQLKYLVDIGLRDEGALLLEFVGVLFDLGLKLEIALGAEGAEQLQMLATHLTERQVATGEINTNVLHFTWQVAKARRFSAALRVGAARALPGDETSATLLAQIAALRTEVPLAEEGTGPGSRIDRTRRLLAFARDGIPAAGATALERMTNLQARFDARLERRLAAQSDVRESELFGLEDLRARLPERTALLQIFLGEYAGKSAVHSLLAARKGTWAAVTPEDRPLLVEFREAERSERAYAYEEDVYLTRSALLDESLTEAQLGEFLHAAGGAFLHGNVGAALDELKKTGCDHLLVVPHGPFHFAPLQLFARGKRLLADEWNVTVLPSIELLRPRADDGADKPARAGVAAFGLGFAGPENVYGLGALPEAVDEARRVAKAFGAEARVDAQATESAVLAALAQARYLHLATHGAMNLDAPSFQYVVVAPAAGGDGLLFAHELLGADLRGVQLVSLSACETALGRIDRADNPRGLPAALLLAGVETIVGTLWEVAGDVARAFFVALYRALAAGGGRGASFRAAQLEVRRRFPHPRDWGAFYLLGGWD